MRLFFFLTFFFYMGCTSIPEKQHDRKDSSVVIQDTSALNMDRKNIPPTPPPPSVVKDSTILDIWRVYTDVYGTTYSNSSNELLTLAKEDEYISYDGYQHVKLDSIIHFSTGGIESALAVMHTNIYDEEDQLRSCHSCGALMSLALYTKAGTIWRLVNANPTVEEFGSYGLLAEYKLQEVVAGKYMFIIQPGFTGQGVTFVSDVFISLPELEVCLTLDTHEDNRGMVEETDPSGYSWDAVYRWLPQKDSSLVLEVTIQGDLPRPFEKTLYKWNEKTKKMEKQ